MAKQVKLISSVLAVLVLLINISVNVQASQEQPNIVVFLLDDLRVDLGTYSSINSKIKA